MSFTLESGKANARKGAAARWQKFYAQKLLPPDPPIVPPALPSSQGANPAQAAQVERIQKQLMRLEELVDKEFDGKELANLTAAHQRLFDAWCTLTSTPRPGSRKPAAAPRAQRQGSGQPAPMSGPLPGGMSEAGAPAAWSQPAPAPIAPQPIVSPVAPAAPQAPADGRSPFGQNADEPNG